MFCGNCGKEIEDNSTFCPDCGNSLANNVGQVPASSINDKCKRIFISPNEQYIASLGNGYINSFLTTKDIKRCVAILSNKRVYLHGNMIDTSNGGIEKYNIEKIINVDDITGTGFIYASEKIWKLVLAVLTAPIIIPAILLIISYLKGRNTLFFIEYAGGCIKFDASIYGLAESQDFHKQLRRMQDMIKEQKK